MASRKKSSKRGKTSERKSIRTSTKRSSRRNDTAVKRKPKTKHSSRKRSAKKRRLPSSRSRAAKVSARKHRRKAAKRSRPLRKTVERAARPKLKRSREGGLKHYQGPDFGHTKFGGYKQALKTVGEENQHAYDEAVEALREGLDLGLTESTIKRRRRKVAKLAKRKRK